MRGGMLQPGYYQTELNYIGLGRMVWKIENNEGAVARNQQNATSVYAWYSVRWMKFEPPGKLSFLCRS